MNHKTLEPLDYRFVVGVLAGTCAGAGLAMWFAPRAAAELGARVSGAARELGDEATQRFQQASTRMGEAVDDLSVKGRMVRHDVATVVARGAHEVERYATQIAADGTAPTPNNRVHNASLSGIVALLVLAFTMGGVSPAQAQGDLKDEISQSEKAARVFGEIMDTPDKGIPTDLLGNAECVAVFPSVIQAGFIVGGRGGRGVASCRTMQGWSAPAYFTLGGGSVGFQIGAQATDFVMLFMNADGMSSLLKNEFTMGGDASVAAGPIGRQAGAATDLKLTAKILSYSRSKGLFAGLELKGVVIKQDKDDMRDVYGAGITAADVLKGKSVTVPAAIRAFPLALARYSTRNATN